MLPLLRWGATILFGIHLLAGCRRQTPPDPTRRVAPSPQGDTAGGPMTQQYKQRATARTEVNHYAPMPIDEVAGGPALVEVQVTETFTGDIDGEGTARVIQAARTDGSAVFTGIERVRGSIAGRK